ncbi:formylglycine-generating enzyme family protein [Pendulispora brunnea]|uniref:Formylglycine-generating enzyme family protein n=1 Tax=Pendulispora brunnea TaxID=2905690 RepID=A0ABZ2KL55_9BACT
MRTARIFATTLQVSAVLAVSGVACSDSTQEGHIVFYIDTDAPLLSKPRDAPLDLRPPALFDKLRVEFFSPTDQEPCSSCVREFEAREDLFTNAASVTVRGNVDRVRVRLYRGMDLVDGDTSPQTTIDVVARLPPVPAEGAVSVNVLLETVRVGSPNGTLNAPTTASPGSITRGHVGTWAPARRTPCAGPANKDEVCVPGGAFFMGSSRSSGDLLNLSPRLIVLSPFFLDAHEVTIGAIADWAARTKKDPKSFLVLWDEQNAPGTNFCTYGRPNRDLPVNCILKSAALEYCHDQGKTLPTEAQFEYVASSTKSSPFVWGRPPPKCGEAVWGVRPELLICPQSSTGPIAWTDDTVRKLDRLPLRTGAILDLAGNLSEYVLDNVSVETDPCWQLTNGGFLQDPLCTRENTRPDPRLEDTYATRGGSWNDESPERLRSTVRGVTFAFSTAEPPANSDVGFRCARKP